jgi:hypothetical protein
MLPGEATLQDGGVGPLFRRKCALHWVMEVLGRIKSDNFAQTRAFRFQTLFDFRVIFNLDEARRHIFLRQWTLTCVEVWMRLVEDSFVTVRVECEAGNGNSVNKQFSRSIQICF